MQLNYLKHIFIFFIFLFLVGFTVNREYKIIKNYGVSVQYPKRWDVVEEKGYKIIVKEKAKSNIESVLCSFAVEIDYEDTILVNNWVSRLTQLVSNPYIENWEIESDNGIIFKGFSGREIKTHFSFKGSMCRTKIIIIKQKGRILNLSTTSLDNEFDRNKLITDYIFEKIEFY